MTGKVSCWEEGVRSLMTVTVVKLLLCSFSRYVVIIVTTFGR